MLTPVQKFHYAMLAIGGVMIVLTVGTILGVGIYIVYAALHG